MSGGMEPFEEAIRRAILADTEAREREVETSLYAQLCGRMGRVMGSGPLQVVYRWGNEAAAVVTRSDIADFPDVWKAP